MNAKITEEGKLILACHHSTEKYAALCWVHKFMTELRESVPKEHEWQYEEPIQVT